MGFMALCNCKFLINKFIGVIYIILLDTFDESRFFCVHELKIETKLNIIYIGKCYLVRKINS